MIELLDGRERLPPEWAALLVELRQLKSLRPRTGDAAEQSPWSAQPWRKRRCLRGPAVLVSSTSERLATARQRSRHALA